MNVSLENEQGKRGPYIVNITVINTPPKFLEKDEMTILEEVSVRLNEKDVKNLPGTINLENQALTLSLSDNKTG